MEEIMIVGKFKVDNDIYTGCVPVLSSLAVSIVPSKKKAVDYDVLLGEDGAEFGVAWKKTSGKGNTYLSIKLDSPLLPASVHCALLKQDDGSHALVWKRSTADAKADDVPEAAAA
jgi:uncharacterized protein (DUF736 family)